MSPKAKTPKPRLSALDFEIEDLFANHPGYEFDVYKDALAPSPPPIDDTPPDDVPTIQSDVSKALAGREQGVSKPLENSRQDPYHQEAHQKADSELNAVQMRSNVGSNAVQTRSNIGLNAVQYLTETDLPLRGTGRDALDYFSKVCSPETLTTPALSRKDIESALKVPFETARTAIKKLRKKGHIEKTIGGKGRAGWTQYVLSRSAFDNLTKSFLNTV